MSHPPGLMGHYWRMTMGDIEATGANIVQAVREMMRTFPQPAGAGAAPAGRPEESPASTNSRKSRPRRPFTNLWPCSLQRSDGPLMRRDVMSKRSSTSLVGTTPTYDLTPAVPYRPGTLVTGSVWGQSKDSEIFRTLRTVRRIVLPLVISLALLLVIPVGVVAAANKALNRGSGGCGYANLRGHDDGAGGPASRTVPLLV